MEGSCEHCNELSGSIKVWEIFQWHLPGFRKERERGTFATVINRVTRSYPCQQHALRRLELSCNKETAEQEIHNEQSEQVRAGQSRAEMCGWFGAVEETP
jgi:hypothetical protein